MPKLEVGKSYKNGEGETVKIISHSKHAYEGVYPFIGDNGECYTPSGGFTVLGQISKDLVEELEPEQPDPKTMIELEVGRTYKSYKGEIVKIISRESGDYEGFYHFQGDNLKKYAPDGSFSVQDESVHDLIEEVKPTESKGETETDRKELAGWFRKIADALESDEYSEFVFHQGELTIDQRQTYPESDSCSTEVAIEMAFDLIP